MTAILTWARLSYRQQRWELIVVAIGVALTVAGMLWFAGQLTELRGLVADCFGGQVSAPACDPLAARSWRAFDAGQQLLRVSWLAPFALGVILGAPLVAREVESRTAQLAWTLAPSRVRWLVGRVAFAALITALLLAPLALASEHVAATLDVDRDLTQDFNRYGERGWLLVARGGGVLALSALIGALIGRVLPAILAAALVVGLVATGLGLGLERWLLSEAVPQRIAPSGDPSGDYWVDVGLEMTDGRIYTWDEVTALGIEASLGDEEGARFASEADMAAGRVAGYEVAFKIPGSRYPEVVARESAVVIGLGLVALAATAWVVQRRRPV